MYDLWPKVVEEPKTRNPLELCSLQRWEITQANHNFGGCPGVPVHGGIPIVFISTHGVVTHSLMFRSFVYRDTRTQPNFDLFYPHFCNRSGYHIRKYKRYIDDPSVPVPKSTKLDRSKRSATRSNTAISIPQSVVSTELKAVVTTE